MSTDAAPHTNHVAAAFRAAFRASLPVLTGYLCLGSGYGVLMNELGYGPAWTAALSIIIYGGTIQYIATTLLAASYQPLYALCISALVNARHLFYGFSLLNIYAGAGWKKPFLVFWLTDETFSLVCSGEVPEGADANWYRFFISALDYAYWVAGGLVGNIAGHLLQFNSKGIDFVMTALFTVIVVNQWREARSHSPALIGGLASLACLILLGADYFLIPAMLVIVGVLLLMRKRLAADIRREEEEACS